MDRMVRNMVDEVERIKNGEATFRSIYIEGYYGSGKTLLIRKFVSEAVSSIDEALPLIFYLGQDGLAYEAHADRLFNSVNSYVETGKSYDPRIAGSAEDWGKRLTALEYYRNYLSEVQNPSTNDFFNAIKTLEKKYIPIVIFDEFERLLYTGDGIKSQRDAINFAELIRRYLELTRGHIYSGVFIIATTRPIDELLKMAINEGRPHLESIARHVGVDFISQPRLFPMTQQHITYHVELILEWNDDDLLSLNNTCGNIIDRDVIYLLSKVLPTPRALIKLIDKARTVNTQGAVGRKDFYELVRTRLSEFIDEMKRARDDKGRYIVGPRDRWLKWFEELVRGGYIYITPGDYSQIAGALGVDGEGPNAGQKVVAKLRRLAEKGLLERTGPGEYMLSRDIAAYLLNIRSLVSGESIDRDKIVGKVKAKIIEARRRSRK